MKKILCIALFSIAIMANATEKKGVVVNNSKEIVTNTAHEKVVLKNYSNEVMVNDFKEIKTVKNKCSKETSENDMFFGCGSQGNSMYNEYRAAGMDHRDARSERRAWVRECRGNGPDGWLSIFISWA
jgi:hypothetical protein